LLFNNVLLICTADHYQNEPVHLHHLVRCQCNLLEMVMTKMRTPDMSDNDIDTVVGRVQQDPLENRKLCQSYLPPYLSSLLAEGKDPRLCISSRVVDKGNLYSA